MGITIDKRSVLVRLSRRLHEMAHVVEDHNMIYPSALSPASGHMSWQSTYYATGVDKYI